MTRSFMGLLVGLVLGATAAAAQAQQAPTPAAANLAQRLTAEFAMAKAAAATPQADRAAELARRVGIEQAGRKLLMDPAIQALTPDERRFVTSAVFRDLAPVDADNLAYLKSILPAEGWFNDARDGKGMSRNAWLIVQHAQDAPFQEAMLKRMEPAVLAGEISGAQFAMLSDRLALRAGRPQLYGTQLRCEGGMLKVAPTADPERLAARRARLGVKGDYAEYLKVSRVGAAC